MRTRKRRSIIWLVSRDELQAIVSRCETITAILQHFKLVSTGCSRKILFRRLEEDKIDYSHIPTGANANKGRPWTSARAEHKTPLSLFLTKDSSYSRQSLKRRLLKEKWLKNECALCHCDATWRGKPLVLVLDHINGINNDNRLQNLRLLCPNCNSQQPTFCGSKKRRLNNCLTCGVAITSQRRHCEDCHDKVVFEKDKNRCRGQRKVERPSLEQLLEETKAVGYLATGRKYGVSDNAIRKWIKFYQKYGE